MTNIELVRLNIQDQTGAIFSDAEITAFLEAVNNNINLATAKALRSMATRAALTQSFSVGSYSETSNANALINLAIEYEKKAFDEGVAPDGYARGYDTEAEIAITDFNTIEIINNKIIKSEV